MTELPRHVGRQIHLETGYALVCNFTPGGNPHTDPLCGKPAVRHFRWEEATVEWGLACAGHIEFALAFDPYDHHGVENSACGMPGSWWQSGNPSRCVMVALDEEPALAGAAPIGATA